MGKGGYRTRSDWEHDEARERMRHAAWLVDHGARKADVAREFGVGDATIENWCRKYGKQGVTSS